MRLFPRRTPPAIRARLDRSEYVAAWAATAEDAPVAVTNLGLWWPEGSGSRRIGWERIDKAVWADGELTIIEADVVDDLLLVERPPASVRLAEPRSVPAAVRRRVESTVAQRHDAIVDGHPVRIVARRVPGRDGLSWWARLPATLSDTPVVRLRVRDAIERVRPAEAE